MTHTTRGMTLVEVLLATVLMTALAVVCLPVLRAVPTAAGEARPPTLTDLSLFADECVADPAAFGDASLSEPGRFVIAVHDRPDWEELQIEVLDSGEAGPSHRWVVFRCGDVVTCRWTPIKRAEGD